MIVEVEGQDFKLHMLPLLNASLYFRTLPSTSKGFQSDSPQRVVLHEMVGGAKAFSVAADFCYLIKPSYTVQNIVQIRAVAEYLGMMELLESTKDFLYMNIFSHWRASIAFLQQYRRLGSPPVDEYVESRCLKVISAACVKAFFDTKYLCAPIPLNKVGSPNTWQSSPSQMLTDILVRTCSLQDEFVEDIVEELVTAEVNLNLKCRQGRNVKGWLENLISTECRSNRAKCWVVICLTRMLEKSVTSDRPWLELSSQYWCAMLQHACSVMKEAQLEMLERLLPVNAFLEHRIGSSLHELDEYLLSYRLEPRVMLSLVRYFRDQMEEVGDREVEEVSLEVDSCLWNFVDDPRVSPRDLTYLIQSFPPTSRNSHDLLYAAIEKLLEQPSKCAGFSEEEKHNLWGLVEVSKLSPPFNDKALNNPQMLCQPQVLEYVLQQHSLELERVGMHVHDNYHHHQDGASSTAPAPAPGAAQNLRSIVQKVVKASLKLLEENSRRSMEIMALQKQYTELLGSSRKVSSLHIAASGPESALLRLPHADQYVQMLKSRGAHSQHIIHHTIAQLHQQDELEELQSEVPARGSACSSVEF